MSGRTRGSEFCLVLLSDPCWDPAGNSRPPSLVQDLARVSDLFVREPARKPEALSSPDESQAETVLPIAPEAFVGCRLLRPSSLAWRSHPNEQKKPTVDHRQAGTTGDGMRKG